MSRLQSLFLSYLFVENRLRLTTITLLLAIITTFTLSSCRIFALLVLGYFVRAGKKALRGRSLMWGSRFRRTCASCTVCPCSLKHASLGQERPDADI